MEKEIYFLFDSHNVHEYTFIAEEKLNKHVYYLKSGSSSEWTKPDSKLIKVTDTGNGLKIKTYDFELSNKLDYAYAEYLHLILQCVYNHDKTISDEYKVIKEEVFNGNG